MNRCKSCNLHIIWMKTAKGKAMPVDLFNQTGAQIDFEAKIFDPKTMVSHFASCLQAKEWRKTRKAQHE